MNKSIITTLTCAVMAMFISLFYHGGAYAQPVTIGDWAWMGGADHTQQTGVYGTRGVANDNNMPGARYNSISCQDNSGNVWMFGGYTTIGGIISKGQLNDLWKYNPATNQWTWMSGDTITKQPGVYGTLGVADPLNKPGARQSPAMWIDASGSIWLFGGYGYDASGTVNRLNDLWKYDPSANEWTWIGGSKTAAQPGTYGTKGSADAANIPGARNGAAVWTDASGNFWLFGGYGFSAPGVSGYLNDLWKYDLSNHKWIWMSGSNTISTHGTYGIQGTPDAANTPGARGEVTTHCWADKAGNLWLFGGDGYSATSGGVGSYKLNDLWRYNISSGMWTWMSGSNGVNSAGDYGTQGVFSATNVPAGRSSAAVWGDKDGNLWVFAGYSASTTFGKACDLWKYDVTLNQWVWVKGPKPTTLALTVYGTKGQSDVANMPGCRGALLGWADKAGNFWVFGGQGWATSSGSYDALNDLWKLAAPAATGCSPTTATVKDTACSSFEFNHHTYTVSGTYVDTLKNANAGGCDSIVTLNLTIQPLPFVKAESTPTPAAICMGEKVTLDHLVGFSPDPISYTWDKGVINKQAFTPTQTETYTITATDQVTGCINTDTITVTIKPAPKISALLPSSPICDGDTVTLSGIYIGFGSATFQWDNGVVNGQPFVPHSTQTYTVTGTDNITGCSGTAKVTIVVNPLPTVTATANPGTDICEGNEVTLNGGGADTYSWDKNVTDGKAFVPAQTETYTVIGTDANGCVDSADIIVTLKDTVATSITDSICSGDTYTFGTQTLDKSGTYTEVFVAANGCDSTVNLHLTVNTVDVSITQNGNELKATDGATSYQWINCQDKQPIAGATNQTYTSKDAGDFAVVVTKGDCTDTSVCYHLEGEPKGISGVSFSHQVTLYPNPNSGQMTLHSGYTLTNATARVINVVGQTVKEINHISGNSFSVDIHQYAAGIYYVEIRDGAQTARVKFTKE